MRLPRIGEMSEGARQLAGYRETTSAIARTMKRKGYETTRQALDQLVSRETRYPSLVVAIGLEVVCGIRAEDWLRPAVSEIDRGASALAATARKVGS